MTAARALTDADLDAIREIVDAAVARRLRSAARTAAPKKKTPVDDERRDEIRADVIKRMSRKRDAR